jgi:two-component system LytT family response regulator
VFLRLADIDWAEAADNYVNLHVGTESHLFRETMNALERRLSAKQFVRISRSAMVNIEQIKELQPMFHGEYVVVLRNGTKLTLTRGYREKLRELSLM